MSEHRLDAIDTLISHLSEALLRKDWEEMARLNQLVRPTIDPLMSALEAGEIKPEPVRERLARLRTFCDQASASAEQAKDEARQALEGVNQNRSAARAYQNVSLNPPK